MRQESGGRSPPRPEESARGFGARCWTAAHDWHRRPKAGIYDEEGYLALPPCLWGEEPGLHPSILLPPNTPLVSIKKNRNTHQGHYGEMASWQMRGISF